MNTLLRCLMVCAAISAVLLSAPMTTTASASGSVSVNDLIPSMSSGQAYSERYSFAVDLDNGGHVGMNWTISNLGIRNGYGAAEVRVRHPDIDDYNSSERKRRSDWSYDEERFELNIADSTVRAVDDGVFELRYDGGDVRIELRFENTIDMWRPDAIESGSDFYRFTMVSPRANVTGRVYIEGQWYDVAGTNSGYADHVVTNVAPYNLASRFTRMRQYDDEVFVMWREVGLTDDFGGGSNTWIVVGVGDQIVYADTNPEVRYGDLERDDETGYYVPDAIQVLSQQGDDELRLTLRRNEHHRTDLLAHHGRMARMVASAVSDPYQYDVHGEYALQVNVGDRRLRLMSDGHVTIDYVNH